uniref:Non-specific serine/threonine protein kinase n=2 Tax=Caenorhabditis tropicalis TaxID=1561998 RepID=A0A1I7UJE6_9PELO
MTELRNQIDQLLRWEGTKNQKEEVEENQEKWEKEDKKYRTSLFELSIRHLKTCCRQQIDHNTINWIPYILTILDFQWIQSEGAMENELSRVLLLCSMASQLHWAEHLHVKTLWEFIWKRVEDPQCLDNIMKDYVEVAVEILKNVDTVVFEKSALDLVRTVIGTFKKVVEVDHKKEWSHKRKYSVVYVLSFIVRRWGLEARDFILREIFDLIDYMLSLISVDLNSGESKIYMMHLVDDVIKLSMIETVKSHRTIDEKTEENVRNLVKTAIFESLKSASKTYALSSGFSISDEYIRYLARWILAEIELEGSESMDESFDSSAGKKKEWNEFSLNGLIHLTFGAHSLNQLVAWEGALQILTEVLLTRKLNTHQSEKILTILWEKRKSFHSETLRIAFCQLLSTVIPLDLRFGHRNIPSIDSILKYSLNVIQTLPVAASLTENILRYRSRQVPKAGLQLIWDTVSRTSPGSIEVIRLINALIAFTEFDENSRFANDENVGNWSLRKDVVEWLLADPKANSHLLIFELCQYHPIFCFFDTNQTWNDDQLIQTMRKCSLMKSPVEAKESTRPLDASIQEIVNYVHDKLKSILTSEINLPVFILSYEFSRKFPEVVIDFSRTYQKLSHIVEEMEEEEFLNSVEHLSEWPRDLKLPAHLQNSEPSYMTYLIKNLHNPLIDWTQWIANREKIIEKLIEIARNDRKMREKMRKSIQLNKFIREFIQENAGDPYEMTKRYERFSFLLSDRNLMSVWDGIRTRATKALEEDAIGDPDLFIFEKLISSSFLRNVSTPHILDGSHFDPTTVSIHADHMDFNEKSIKIYLKSLRKSPFLAQNIVRKVLENGDDTWHLHAKMLKNVMKNERLLTICIATIPNMVRYLRIYQIQYPPSSKTTRFLTFAPDPIATCQKYLRKPKENGNSITANNLMLLFGTEKSTWKRAIIRFWRLFESDPALVADRFFEFATESIELGLKHRIVSIMNSLTSSEFSRIKDPELKMIFELTQRAIFVNLTREECSPKLLNMSNDSSFCADFYKNRIAEIPMEYAEEVERFEERIALAVENFLKFGIETASVNYMDFGLTEFYQQLNENLTEKAIKANESRNIYLVDCLSTVWLQLPSMRPNIRPIVARFKGISAAWSRFPQPPHLQPNAEQSFLWRARLQITLKMMSQGKWRRGKFATCCTCLLTSFDGRHLRRDLIEKKEMNRLKRETQRNVLCILSKILKKEIDREEGEAVVAKGFYEAFTMASSVFPDIAAITVPFLFKICVDFKEKYEFAVGKLLACLKGVQKEDEHVVYCLAECVDSIGLDVIARYERVDIDSSPQFGPHWYFVLARLFLKHGYLTHAFAIANVLFDRLSSKKRNLMMIERISLEGIEKPKEMIDLLVEIYVAENNSIALSSLPPDVQNRDDVRQVMDKNSKKWLSLVSSKQLNPRESSLVQWMCGLPPNSSGDKYLDSIIRFDFKQYPKHLDSPMKIVYFTLFHQQIGTVIPPKLVNFTPTIDEMRLILIAQKTIHPESIEEHMIKAVRDLRKTINRREAGELKYARDINLKTARIVKLSEMLTENHAFEAAHLLLKTWEEECLKWNVPSIDIDLIRIYRGFVTGQSWDPRIAEINLRSMQPRVGTMSAVAIAEWASALSKITIEYRNDLEEGIRILELGCRHLQNKDSLEARLQLLLKFHSVCLGQLSKLEEYRGTRGYRIEKEVISEFEAQLQNSARLSRGASGDEARRAMQRMRKEQQIEKADVEKVEKLVVSAAQKAVSSAFDALCESFFGFLGDGYGSFFIFQHDEEHIYSRINTMSVVRSCNNIHWSSSGS